MGLGLIAIIVAVASVVASVAMGAKQKKDMEDMQAGIMVQKQGGTHAIPVVYGQRRIAPIKIWEDISRHRLPISSVSAVADSGFTHNGEFSYISSRDDEDFLHRLDVWAVGPVESISDYEIDDDPMTHKRFINAKSNRPYFRSLNKHGAASQSMFSGLRGHFSGITSDMKGNGLAYSWNSFLYTADTPKYWGDPKVTAVVKGLSVWDPRTNTTGWSDNPSLILLDYLTADHGKGLSQSDLDIQSFIDAANECDVVETLPAQETETEGRYVYIPAIGEYIWVPADSYNPNGNTTTSQKRFTCNIVLQPDVDSKENVTEILKTFKASLPFINGQYVVSMEVAGTSVMSFNNDNVIGGISIGYADRAKRLNQVTVKFPNKLKGYKDDAVTWPKSTSSEYTTYLSEDSNEKLTTEATLSGVTSHAQAIDMAEFMVKDSRNQQIVTFKAQPLAMQLEPNDIITVSTDALGITNKPYRVRSVKLSVDLTVEINAQEYDANVYPWNVTDPEPAPEYIPSTIFDEPAAMQNFAGIASITTNQDGTAQTAIALSWDTIESGTSSVDRINVGYKLANSSTYVWTTLPSNSTEYVITGLQDNATYDVVAHYRNIVGNTSADVVISVTTPINNTDIQANEDAADQAADDAAQAAADAAQAAADAAAAAAAAAAADAAAAAAQSDADAAQADATQGIADAVAANSAAAQAASDAAAAASLASAAQATADLAQTSQEVLDAIEADTTVIDGARITTGTIAAARISISGLSNSDLSNDEGFTDDTAATAAQTTATNAAATAASAAGAAAAAQSDADAAQAAADDALADALANNSSIATVSGVATAAASAAAAAATAASNAQATADLAQTASEVATAISLDTTVIDGSRITTGTVAAARISISGLSNSDLSNDEGFTDDTTANAAASAASAAQTTATNAASTASSAAGAAAAAALAASNAQDAADDAQTDATNAGTDATQALADAASAATAASNAQATADLAQTASEVATAISLDTTVIDGARITTGTIAAARISISGLSNSDLSNDEGFTDDTTANAAAAAASTAQTTATNAASAAATAAGNASAAQSAADTAQQAADDAQADATANAADVITAQSAADAAATAASNAQATADLAQTASEVATAISLDTTVIDGARITTGTINAARISISGLSNSDLENDEGYTDDTAANAAQTTATNAASAAATAASAASAAQTDATNAASAAATAAGAASTAQSAADDAQDAADAAQADATANAADVLTAQAAADAAQAAADSAQAVADLAQTASDVATAISLDTTVIDGARITTGTIAASRISISGINASELNNDAFAVPGDIPDVSNFQTSTEVNAAIAADTTVIDGARISTGTIASANIAIGTGNPSIVTDTVSGKGAVINTDGDFFCGDADGEHIFFDRSAGSLSGNFSFSPNNLTSAVQTIQKYSASDQNPNSSTLTLDLYTIVDPQYSYQPIANASGTFYLAKDRSARVQMFIETPSTGSGNASLGNVINSNNATVLNIGGEGFGTIPAQITLPSTASVSLNDTIGTTSSGSALYRIAAVVLNSSGQKVCTVTNLNGYSVLSGIPSAGTAMTDYAVSGGYDLVATRYFCSDGESSGNALQFDIQGTTDTAITGAGKIRLVFTKYNEPNTYSNPTSTQSFTSSEKIRNIEGFVQLIR